jgi:hypothetical protein
MRKKEEKSIKQFARPLSLEPLGGHFCRKERLTNRNVLLISPRHEDIPKQP